MHALFTDLRPSLFSDIGRQQPGGKVWGDSLDPILKLRCSLYTGARRVHKAPNSQWPPESQCPLAKATPPVEDSHPFWEGFEQSQTQGHQRKSGEITQWAEVFALICDGLSSVLGSRGRRELTPKGVALQLPPAPQYPSTIIQKIRKIKKSEKPISRLPL